jgi:hypothetical protein
MPNTDSLESTDRMPLMGPPIEGARPPAFDLAGARDRARAQELQTSYAGRMRDLEALASAACEENERLEAEVARLNGECESLQRRIMMLEAAIADPRATLGLPALGPGSCDPRELDPDELPIRGHLARAVFATVLMGAVGAATLLFASGLVAVGGGPIVTARLHAPLAATLAGASELLDGAVARASSVHPRYGRDLVPAGWAPTLPEPAAAPVVAAPVIAPAPPAPQPAVAAPPAKKHAPLKRPRPHRAAARPTHAHQKADGEGAGALDL